MKIKVVTTLFISFIFLTACGGGSSDIKKPSTPKIVLEGAWISNSCEDAGDGTFYQESMTVSGNAYTEGKFFYRDSLCSSPFKSEENTGSGTFKIGDTVMTPYSNLLASKVDTIDQDNISVFTLMYLENGKFYTGDTLSNPSYDGSTADKRPIELDLNEFMTKIDPALQGRWNGVCEDSGNNDGYSIQGEIRIFGNTASIHVSLFTDSSCSIIVASANETFKLELGNSLVASNMRVTELNTYNLDTTPDQFDIYHVSNNILYLGDSDSDVNYDGTTAAKRPIALDLTSYFTKYISEANSPK